MTWPTGNAYIDAMKHPARRFCRPELKRGQPVLGNDGKPIVHVGKWLDVYEMRDASGQDRWAIGCFTKEPKGLARRYHLINEHLQVHPVPAIVDSEYIEQGISIRGRWYPIMRSHWVEGRTLNAHVREFLDFPDELRLLADQWLQLAQELRQAGLAHGNLAADTVLVAPGPGGVLNLRLLDYDGLFVPALADNPPEEMGHPDFQHPGRSWQHVYNADADSFSQMLVLTALYALATHGRPLWDRFDNGHNLLFRQSDLLEPVNSPLLRELWQSESGKVRALAGRLILACSSPIVDVPPIDLVADYVRPGAPRLTEKQVDQINKLLDMDSASEDFGLEIDEDAAATCVRDDFVLEVDDEPTPAPAGVDVDTRTIAQDLPALPGACPPSLPRSNGTRSVPATFPALSAATPPPLPPPNSREHPMTLTYQFDAWMPEQVAVVKLQGFVKGVGGLVTTSIPGYIRVHLFDERYLAKPAATGFLAWLGGVQQPQPPPRVAAVLELDLVHKPTLTRQLIGVTLRLTPGADAENDTQPARWKLYCDRIFCELRGYAFGTL